MKELDAFPKVPESYVETSASGGTGRHYWRAHVMEIACQLSLVCF